MLVMDFRASTYDYNDNTYIITNIRPESGAGAPPMARGAAAAAGEWDTFSATKIAADGSR
jgi:hypothetical protein